MKNKTATGFASLAIVIAGFALPGNAWGQSAEDKTSIHGKKLWLDTYGEYRFWAPWVSTFSVSPDDETEWDAGVRMMERLRTGVAFGGRSLSLHVEGDLFYGTFWGEYPQPGSDATHFPPLSVVEPESFQPRKFYLQWRTPIGLIRAGHQLSNWGLGLISNSGTEGRNELFSQRENGDAVERFLFVTAPFALASKKTAARNFRIGLGFDLIYKDENASLPEGDLAFQYFGSLLYQAENWELGTFIIYRDQTDGEGTSLEALAPSRIGTAPDPISNVGSGTPGSLNALVLDIYARLSLPVIDDDLLVLAALEAAYITGHTTRTRPWNSPDGVDISAFGFVADIGVHIRPIETSIQLKLGYASGDSDLDDGTLNRFRFDPDFNVGLIYFDHYLAGMTAAAIDRARNAEHAAVPPDGLAGFPTDGAAENTFFLAPVVTYGGDPGPAMQAMFILLWSASPMVSPYETFAAGGEPRGYRGADTGSENYAGLEVDFAIMYRIDIAQVVTLELKGEAGVFYPGSVFADANSELPGSVIMAGGRLGVVW